MSERAHSIPPDGHGEPVEPDPELLAQMRQQLASVSAADFVAELAAHLLNMATVRLGLPAELNAEFKDLGQARLLIDALAGLLDGSAGRLGPVEPQLREGLAQFRMAWVELAGAAAGSAEQPAQDSGLATPPPGLWVPGMD
jgi:Domain of unknown function (DUF1844)